LRTGGLRGIAWGKLLLLRRCSLVAVLIAKWLLSQTTVRCSGAGV
jgi:hypothetical protein